MLQNESTCLAARRKNRLWARMSKNNVSFHPKDFPAPYQGRTQALLWDESSPPERKRTILATLTDMRFNSDFCASSVKCWPTMKHKDFNP